MLNPDRVYMFAADHRWQWEEWCDAHAVARVRIPEAKRVAFDGFLLAHRASSAVRDFGALLIDEQYASGLIAEGLRAGITVGTPVERAGSFPLAWWTEPFWRALTGAFVKVLVRHRPDHEARVRDEQFARLDALQAWCRDAGKPLVIEVLVPRQGEPEDDFDATTRPAIVASFIRDAYRRGLRPSFWKIEGTTARDGARVIDAAVAECAECRHIVLGKGADVATIEGWFDAARESRAAAGFAIGRSVYWEPAAMFLSGRQSAEDAVRDVCRNYLQLIALYDARRAPATL